MKFAFLILGDFRATEDRAEIHHGSARMIGVSIWTRPARRPGSCMRRESAALNCAELSDRTEPEELLRSQKTKFR